MDPDSRPETANKIRILRDCRGMTGKQAVWYTFVPSRRAFVGLICHRKSSWQPGRNQSHQTRSVDLDEHNKIASRRPSFSGHARIRSKHGTDDADSLLSVKMFPEFQYISRGQL